MKSDEVVMILDKHATGSRYGGITSKAMGEVNGEKVMIKNGSGAEAFNEYFAYALGTRMGYKVNKVQIINFGDIFGLDTICSVHWWEDDFVKACDSNYSLKEMVEANMRFFDKIISNGDRHDSNYGFVRGELFLIDNGYSAPFNLTSIDTNSIAAITAKENFDRKYLENFLSITDEEIREMIKLPFEIIAFTGVENIVERTVERMRNIREFLLEEVRRVA